MSSTVAYVLPFTGYPYRGEAVACDLCGEDRTETICEWDRRFKRLRTVACIRCGLMRTDPMPTAEEVRRYYGEAYRWDYQFAGRRGPSRRHLNRSHREVAVRLARLQPALRPGARVLDFGSGAGVFLAEARAAGLDAIGIEPGEDYAEWSRETFGVTVINRMWEEIADPLGPFDVITAVEVLEHLRRPVAALRWLAGMLAEGGVLYATVPDMRPNDKETFRRFHFAHLYGFTPTTLEWAGRAAGLELDPRVAPVDTKMTFRKTRAAAPLTFGEDQGRRVKQLYPDASIAQYVLSGRMLVGRARQLGRTVRDTFAD
jgi:2-polyprenyl-3-methyl-5-hydroxy-6-metoxy-1,4-benzoquinol methylase